MDALLKGLESGAALDRPAGVEVRQELEPAGNLPVQPPSYEGRMEIHNRHVDGKSRPTIELDSVGSCANRIEEVLLALHRAGDYPLPVSDTTIAPPDGEPITITTLEAPHRIFDAWIRLSADPEGDGHFQDSEQGRALASAHLGALDPVLETSAHDLVFGAWDSQRKGPQGQLRIARALTSSVVGFDPVPQAQFAARRDPLNMGESKELPKGAKKLSEQGLSSIPPQRRIPYTEDEHGNVKTFGGKVIDHNGGVSITSARYSGFLSFPALRRLSFLAYEDVDARTTLALLALYSMALRCAQGWDLRARCSLIATAPPQFSIVNAVGERDAFDASPAELRALLDRAIDKLAITDRSVHLEASPELNSLVATSAAAAS